MRLALLSILLLWSVSIVIAAEPTTDSPQKQQEPPKAGKTPPVEDPPKKTEYDKLPLSQLVTKANRKDLTAQFELASRFNYGRGVPRNTREALKWLRKAAQAGQEDAARLLAVKLYNGHDVPADFAEAMKWASLLAEKGDIPAQLMVANMYGNGEGTHRDLVQAYKWYAIAAVGTKPEGGEQEPNTELVQTAVDNRDKLASLLTEEQETLGQQLASDWWMQKHLAKEPVKTGKQKRSVTR